MIRTQKQNGVTHVTHPAYPTDAQLAIEDRADYLFNATVANNERIRAILAECAAQLAKCDMTGVSMVPGYDLGDITKAIEELTPQTADKAMVAHAEDCANDQANRGW